MTSMIRKHHHPGCKIVGQEIQRQERKISHFSEDSPRLLLCNSICRLHLLQVSKNQHCSKFFIYSHQIFTLTSTQVPDETHDNDKTFWFSLESKEELESLSSRSSRERRGADTIRGSSNGVLCHVCEPPMERICSSLSKWRSDQMYGENVSKTERW